MLETVDYLDERMQKLPIDQNIKSILFSMSWVATCFIGLKRHFTDEEIKRDNLFPAVKGKHTANPIEAHRISERLGSGGLRDLANQGSQTPGGAGGTKPRDTYTGVNRPKPPKNG